MSPNSAVLAGSTAIFTCHTDSSEFCWTYQKNVSNNDVVDVCDKKRDDKFINRCNVTTHSTDGPHTLTINDVRLSDAGFYSCGDCSGRPTAKGTAYLLVLGKILHLHLSLIHI